MAVEVTSESFSITKGGSRDSYNQAIANYLENGWEVLSTVPAFTNSRGDVTDVFVTFARDLEDDEEETEE